MVCCSASWPVRWSRFRRLPSAFRSDITFDVPERDVWLEQSASFTRLVAIVGVVIAVVAAGGYERVARVANIAAPWMIAVFAACGIVSLAQMEATSMAALSEGKFWSDAIASCKRKNGETDVRVLADRRLRLAVQRSDALWHG